MDSSKSKLSRSRSYARIVTSTTQIAITRTINNRLLTVIFFSSETDGPMPHTSVPSSEWYFIMPNPSACREVPAWHISYLLHSWLISQYERLSKPHHFLDLT